MKFKDLNIKDEFTVYGDEHFNYTFPIVCKCVKVSDTTCQEVDGCIYNMNESDEVSKGWV